MCLTVAIEWAVVTVQNGLFHLNFHKSRRKRDYYYLSITHGETEVCSARPQGWENATLDHLAPPASSSGGLRACSVQL